MHEFTCINKRILSIHTNKQRSYFVLKRIANVGWGGLFVLSNSVFPYFEIFKRKVATFSDVLNNEQPIRIHNEKKKLKKI